MPRFLISFDGGAGFYLNSPNNPNGVLKMNEPSSVMSNSGVINGGGSVAVGADNMMNDAAAVIGNEAGNGAGISLGAQTNASKASHLSMSGISANVGNSATNAGGGILSGDSANTFSQGTGTVSGNASNLCSGPGVSCWYEESPIPKTRPLRLNGWCRPCSVPRSKLQVTASGVC